MFSSALYGRCGRATMLLAALVLLARCDLPTEPPQFDLTTGLDVPLLVDKTFVFMGPSDSGFDALIDTTSSRFDSIFTVDGSNHTIAIMQELDGFDTELPDGVLPHLDMDPVDVSFAARDVTKDAPEGNVSGEIPFMPNGQTFRNGGTITLGASDVQFSGDDFAELSGGTLHIESLLNHFDMAFDELLISISSLRRAPYGPGDSLVIQFIDFVDAPDDLRYRRIERQSGPRNEEIDLTGYRLYAAGNELSYNVYGRNETSNDIRTIRSTDEFSLAVRMDDVVISEVAAELDPLEVSVTEDVDGDGLVDVMNDDEAEVTEFEGLDVFDDVDLGDFQLVGAELRMHVQTNIAADFALYAALVGLDENGEAVYLEGSGSAAVEPNDPIASAFGAGGVPIDPQYLIRLDIQGAPSPDQPVVRTITLNESNSNVDAFISRLPTELRMAARLVVQPDGGRVHLREPFLLETSFGTTIPLALASGLSIDKTFDADLSDLEDVASDTSETTIEEAELVLDYGNGLPLGLDLAVDVLDEFDGVVVSFPKPDQSFHVEPASTDGAGIATQPTDGTFTIGVDQEDLEAMSRGRQIRLRFGMTTDNNGQARLRATDTFTMRLRGSFRVRVSAD